MGMRMSMTIMAATMSLIIAVVICRMVAASMMNRIL